MNLHNYSRKAQYKHSNIKPNQPKLKMLKKLSTIDNTLSIPKTVQRGLNERPCDLVIHYCETYCETSDASHGDKCLVGGYQESPGICDGAGWFINVW